MSGGRLRVSATLVQALVICAAAGLLSVAFGPDNYWDLLYYHLYAPWAYLHGRYLYDIGPAQSQGFLNPTADFLFYGLISSPLNAVPRVVAFIMGAVHGINAVLVLAIARHVFRPLPSGERTVLTGAAFVMGVTGAGFVSLIGTATNDLINSIFVLGSLLGLLKFARPAGEAPRWRAALWPGLIGGAAVGIKYTAAIFAPGLALAAAIASFRRGSVAAFLAFALAALVGFLAAAGHHLFTLWQAFGSPMFPWLNEIFHSPWYEFKSLRDDRFVPHGLWDAIGFPFTWTATNTYVVSEPAMREWRGAIAYAAVAIAAAVLLVRWFRRSRAHGEAAPTKDLAPVIAFAVVSYVCWQFVFSIYRYGVALEMLTGVIAVGALAWIFPDRRARMGVAVALTAVAAATTVYPNWGRGDYGERYVDVRVPPLPPRSIVLIATWEPAAYFIPYAEPSAQYVGIENNYLEISQTNKLAEEVKRLMRTLDRPTFVLSVGAFEPDKLNALLARFGRRLSGAPCLRIWSNLATDEGERLRLCPVADL